MMSVKAAKRNNTMDMTSGSPLKHIIRFAIPEYYGPFGLER